MPCHLSFAFVSPCQQCMCHVSECHVSACDVSVHVSVHVSSVSCRCEAVSSSASPSAISMLHLRHHVYMTSHTYNRRGKWYVEGEGTAWHMSGMACKQDCCGGDPSCMCVLVCHVSCERVDVSCVMHVSCICHACVMCDVVM